MPAGNYRSVSINDELVDRVKELIEKIGTYHSVAEFVSESVRLRVETLEKQHREEQPARKERTRCPSLKANRPN
jgi:Arc/MetJ-type ribon-helix-helix transcriptional regulator